MHVFAYKYIAIEWFPRGVECCTFRLIISNISGKYAINTGCIMLNLMSTVRYRIICVNVIVTTFNTCLIKRLTQHIVY